MDTARKKAVVGVLQKMVRIPSIGPEEGELAAYLSLIMDELGFNDVEIDSVGNVIGKISGKDPGRAPVFFDGHIDTMGPSSTPWQFDPFGGEIHGGRIYGRGTSDMKGSIAAAICAGAFLIEDGFKPARDIYVCGSVSEELVEGAALEPVLNRIRPGVVIIGEATNLQLAVGQRGRAEIVVETLGVPTHTSRPDLGVNAIKLMHRFISEAEKCPLPEDEVLGRAVLEITDIKSFPYPGLSMVPDLCRATYDRRLVRSDTKDEVLAPLLDIAADLERRTPDFMARVFLSTADFVTYTGYGIKAEKYAPAWVQEDEELINRCLGALRGAGINSGTNTYNFCTNGSTAAGKMGIPTVGFGIGDEAEAHRVDESISLEDLISGTKGYMALLQCLTRE